MKLKLQLKKIKFKIDNLSLPVKASLAFMLCSFLQRGISTLTTPIFTRLLTTEQYGYYNIFNSWLEIISVFTTLKLAGSVFTQALVKFDKKKDELTSSTAGLGTLLTLISIGIYLIFQKQINKFFGMSTLIMLCIFVASWATLIFELWAARQRVEYKYKDLVALTIFTSIAKPVLGIVAIICTPYHKAEARIISLVLVELVSYIGLFILFFKKNKNLYNKELWKYSLSLNIPLIPHYLTRTILNQSDKIMIQWMIGFASVGIYGLAHNLAWMMTLVTTAILNTLNPWLFQKIKSKKFKDIGNITIPILVSIAILCFILICIAPELVEIFAPKSYYEAIWVIPPLVISVYFLFMYSLFSAFEFYYEKSGFLMIASTIGGILNIILNYIFIRKYGYIAAAYTTLFCYMFYAVAHYCCMKVIIKTNLNNVKVYKTKYILLITILLFIISFMMMSIYEYKIMRYIILLFITSIIIIKRRFFTNLMKKINININKNNKEKLNES